MEVEINKTLRVDFVFTPFHNLHKPTSHACNDHWVKVLYFYKDRETMKERFTPVSQPKWSNKQTASPDKLNLEIPIQKAGDNEDSPFA